MNNSAQLKYLEAMGIPVWVSRDKVIEKQVVNKNVVSDELQQPINDQNSRNSDDSPLRNSTDKVHAKNSAAVSIIQSLDITDSDPVVSPAIQGVIEDTLESVEIDTISVSNNQEASQDSNLLYKSTGHYIFACGHKNADWLVIGHSPERFTGIGFEPFANEAGVLLDNMIRAVGVNNPREQAYYINILNIDHSEDTSTNSSSKELVKKINEQITIVQPKIILIVGQIAAQNLLDIKEPLINIRSKIHKISNKQIPAVVTYYPSYLLEKPLDKRKAWNDMKLAMSAITNVS